MQTLRTSTDPDGVVTVVLDAPRKSVNTLTKLLLAELGEVVAGIEREKPRGVIFASAKKRSFVAGADIFEISKMSAAELDRHLAFGQELFTRIEELAVPTVAAINGDCLGGGLELALVCKLRIAADDPSISIGLPEVKLGLVPGWGGTVRLTRLIGLGNALPMILAGKTLSPTRAREAGIVDEVVAGDELLAAARERVLSNAPRAASPEQFFGRARSESIPATDPNYPAQSKLIEVVTEGLAHGPAAGFMAERRALVELINSNAAKGLLRIFSLRQGAKRAIANQLHAAPREVKQAAVIGGGVMGAGIAYSLARSGIGVRLIEVDDVAASSALARVRKMFDDDAAAGRATAGEAARALGRVDGGSQWTGLESADCVIEAVVEKMEAKRDVFARLDQLVNADCVLATNTSALSVSEMAAATCNPSRVVGLHFFNPVPRMPLVEVIRTRQSDGQALATAAGLVAKIGKTAVLVNDAPGFIVNRILMPYLAEALEMATAGADVMAVDDALKRWGMPMGPFALLDEIGLDVASHILKTLAGHFGDRIPAAASLDTAVQRGWLGKKSGRGFYVHGGKGTQSQVNAELKQAMIAPRLTSSGGNQGPEEIAWRLVLPMVNEAARLLEEGVVDDADAVDLAMVLGTGFAPFRGGLVHFVDSVGVDVVVGRMQEMATRHGNRFLPAPLLNALAAARVPMQDFANTNRK
jgi:3-hydroxyacyl-CoA dehydrogenase/enoyl-CoA hydratase/3-hydroxybutyryl-CoA epimerase